MPLQGSGREWHNDKMRLWQRRGVWYITFSRGNSRSLKTRDKKKALRIFEELQKEALRGRLIRLEKQAMCLLVDFTEEYIQSRPDKAKATLRADKLALRLFQDFFGNRPLAGINGKALTDFRAFLFKRKLKKSSVNVHIRHLKKALKTAVKWKYLKQETMQDIEDLKLAKVNLGKPIYMREDEVKKLFDKAADFGPMSLAIPIMVCTGISRSDICRPIYITDSVIEYRRKKTQELVQIPIIEKLRPYLQGKKGIIRAVPWTHPDTVGHKFLEVSRAAGLLGISTHKVRHTFATLMLQAGVDIATVSKLLGHRSLEITIRFYGHIVDDLKRKALEKFNAILS